MLPELQVPAFPRLDEYLSTWAMEPRAFAAMWQAIGRIDWAGHLAAAPPKLVSQAELLPVRGGRSVALIPLLGTLMKQRSSMGGTSTVQTRRDIRQAAADPNVSAILLGVESPGGVTAGLDDLAADVRQAAQEQARLGARGRPGGLAPPTGWPARRRRSSPTARRPWWARSARS
jgi:hypothetical protein